MFSFYCDNYSVVNLLHRNFLNNMLYKKGPHVFLWSHPRLCHMAESRTDALFLTSALLLASEGYFLYVFIPVDESAMYLSTSVFMAS